MQLCIGDRRAWGRVVVHILYRYTVFWPNEQLAELRNQVAVVQGRAAAEITRGYATDQVDAEEC